MMIFDIDGCEKKLGYSFKDKMLLRQCFTHASYANEHTGKDNELLEFFGDSIIEFVVTEYLYKNALGDEGDLTQKRAELVSKTPLLNMVKKMGLYEFVLLGRGQNKNHNLEEKLYSSLYEAVVAGIYLDGGIASARKFIKDTLIAEYERTQNKSKTSFKAEVKSQLQEYVQKHKLGTIAYETLYKKGPDHAPEFSVAVTLNGNELAQAIGQSKQKAQANAAQKALERIKKQGGK